MRQFLAACAVLWLVGCASTPGPAVPVNIPVSVPCISEPPVKPILQTDESLLAFDEYSFVISLWRDRLLRQQYEALMEAALEGCL